MAKTNLHQTNEDLNLDDWSNAVLFLCIGEEIIFIKRSENMPTHKGQIGFFGGRKEVGETQAIQTALREFEEESGLSKDLIQIESVASYVKTTKRKVIAPVIGKFLESKEYFSEKCLHKFRVD